jgi:hypothetical protein
MLDDPLRQPLQEVRRGLLRLHKALIDSERAAYEAHSGTTSNGQFLQLLLEDPFFVWLRPFSGLIAAMDESLAGAEGVGAEAAAGFVEEVRSLIGPSDANTGGETRYEEVRARDPNVLFAHVELWRSLGRVPGQGTADVG